jgi:hypothetical protein
MHRELLLTVQPTLDVNAVTALSRNVRACATSRARDHACECVV